MGGSISKKSGSSSNAAAELAARRAAEQRRQELIRRQAEERAREARARAAAAERARTAAVQLNARKGLTVGKSNRAGDGFDSVIPSRRPSLSGAPTLSQKSPATAPKTLTNATPKTLTAPTAADRQFAELQRREGT
ncbi:MAG: hypothetical protein ACO1OB_24530, partial [Archangium sp.]